MTDTDPLAEAQAALATSDQRIAALEAQERAEELAETAAATMAALTDPDQLERISMEEINGLREANPAAFAEMADRLGRLRPAAWLWAQMQRSSANPDVPAGELRGLEPISDENVGAAVAAAGAGGVVADTTLTRMSDAQQRALKASHPELYWRSARALADSGGRTVARVVRS